MYHHHYPPPAEPYAPDQGGLWVQFSDIFVHVCICLYCFIFVRYFIVLMLKFLYKLHETLIKPKNTFE